MLDHFEDEPVGQRLLTLQHQLGYHLSARLDLVDAISAAQILEPVVFEALRVLPSFSLTRRHLENVHVRYGALEIVRARLHYYEVSAVILVDARLVQHALGGANVRFDVIEINAQLAGYADVERWHRLAVSQRAEPLAEKNDGGSRVARDESS